MKTRRVAVIGGGISGLTLAYELNKLKKSANPELDITVFEQGNSPGGTVETERRDGFILEKGPDSFITDKPYALELSRELGLENELLGTNAGNRRSFILRGTKLIPVPEGFYLITPTKLMPFALSGLFSPLGKLRMACEPFVPRRTETSDESIGSFIRRRFGREALERVGQPMLAGIYTGDPDILSLAATMPRFRDLEARYGSVLVGSMRASRARSAEAASGPRYSLFMSYRNGMQTLTDRLAASLGGAALRTGVGVVRVARELVEGGWSVRLSDGSSERFDALCLALPAWASAELMRETAPRLADSLGLIGYESVFTANFGFERAQISHPLDGFGFVVPRTEGRALIACTFADRKFSGRAPEGRVLLRAFAGGAFGREYLKLDDRALEQRLLADLREVLGISGEPLVTLGRRYTRAMVQYSVGHLETVAAIEAEAAKLEGLTLAGSAYRGVGIPDCIRDAREKAALIANPLRKDL